MSSLPKHINDLDRIIHEPSRLAILTVLSVCDEADFSYLLRITGLTNGNLSTHLSKLEAAQLVTIKKQFVGKKPQTLITLTATGGKQVAEHWKQLERLRKESLQAANKQ